MRPPPDDRLVRAAVADTFDAFTCAFQDARLEPDLEDLLWGIVNVLHRAAGPVERELDDNEQGQQRSQREQDGSEVKSVELERLLAEGLTLIERRNAHEVLRDLASDAYDHHFGKSWRPHSGSLVSRKTLTATLIDSRDFIAARKRAETQVMLPACPKAAFTGGANVNDHKAICAAPDRVHGKHPEMVLPHGGSPKGAELIASKWADARKVAQVAFRPDGTRRAKAAPFKRNDQMLDVLPIGVSCSLAPAFRTTSPTRPRRWASRCSTSASAAADDRQTGYRSPAAARIEHDQPRSHVSSGRGSQSSVHRPPSVECPSTELHRRCGCGG